MSTGTGKGAQKPPVDQDRYLRELVAEATARGVAEGRASAMLAAEKTRRHGLPALLSFLLPGLGQLVKGQLLKAICTFIVAAAVTGIAFIALAGGVPLALPAIPVFWIWQVHDAYTAN